jgi:hypothetical protein
VRQEAEELPKLVLVAADDEDVVSVAAQQLVDHARGPAEVPLGLLVHPVLDPVLGAAFCGVADLAQRIGDRLHLAHLVLVHLPDRGRLPVDDQDARAGVLAEHRQHGTGQRGLVDHDLLPHSARQWYLLVQATAGAGEDGDRPRGPALALRRVLDALDVRARRQPVPVIEVAVVGQGADLVQEAVHPGSTSRRLAPGSTRQ